MHALATWTAADWLAFLAACGLVAGALATLATLVVNRVFDVLGVVQLRRQQADMADHQKTLAGAINGDLNKRIANAVAAGHAAAAAGAAPETVAQLAEVAAGNSGPQVAAIAAQPPGHPARVR